MRRAAIGAQIFVYYKIDAADEPAACAQVRQLQLRLAVGHPGLTAELLVRADAAAGSQRTLMEIYRRPGGVDAACQARIAAAAAVLLPLLRSPRHAEVFIAHP